MNTRIYLLNFSWLGSFLIQNSDLSYSSFNLIHSKLAPCNLPVKILPTSLIDIKKPVLTCWITPLQGQRFQLTHLSYRGALCSAKRK